MNTNRKKEIKKSKPRKLLKFNKSEGWMSQKSWVETLSTTMEFWFEVGSEVKAEGRHCEAYTRGW